MITEAQLVRLEKLASIREDVEFIRAHQYVLENPEMQDVLATVAKVLGELTDLVAETGSRRV